MIRESRPKDELASLVARLNATAEPDEDLIVEIGVGLLENVVREHGDELWPEIERLARSDRRFRRALSCVWAYDSPEFERREALLRELGEWWPIAVRFVVEPRDFTPYPRLAWRAVEIDGDAGTQLPRLLREIADWAARERPTGNPLWVSDRLFGGFVMRWSDAVDAVARAEHALMSAESPNNMRAIIAELRELRLGETVAWDALSDAAERRSELPATTMTYREALAAARSPFPPTRATGAFTLARYNDRDAVDALNALLRDRDDTRVVEAAVDALLERRDTIGAALVCAALGEVDADVGDDLLWAIHRMWRPGGVPVHDLCETVLRESTDDTTRRGAQELLDWLPSRDE